MQDMCKRVKTQVEKTVKLIDKFPLQCKEVFVVKWKFSEKLGRKEDELFAKYYKKWI